MRTAVLVLPQLGLLLLALLTPVGPVRSAGAQDQQWTILPGCAIGPIRLGMSAGEVVQVVGRPTSRATDRVWTYATPFKGRVGFHNGKVSRIETWDPRAVTADALLRVGSGRSAALRQLGANPAAYPMPSGTWFHGAALGLAVFINGDAARGIAVMPPAPGITTRLSAKPTPLPRTERARPEQAGGPSPAPGAQIILEQLSHRVGSTVTVSGILRNAGTIQRLYVALVISAKTFQGDSPGDKRVIAASSLEPGGRQPFTVDIGKDLWESYAVRVDSYSPRQSGERLAAASGFITRRAYGQWLSEDFSAGAHVSTSTVEPGPAGPAGKTWAGKVRVSASITLPSYARAEAVAVRVRWELRGRPGASASSLGTGERQVVLRPGAWDAEIAVAHADLFTINILEAAVVRVDWRLNF